MTWTPRQKIWTRGYVCPECKKTWTAARMTETECAKTGHNMTVYQGYGCWRCECGKART